ncbi:MAG: hypothetical protein BGO44_04305 [Legionella sp. 39-23]|nr:MAG: hypothetical protein BGO44_04305 [Legionella sp. 39-23]
MTAHFLNHSNKFCIIYIHKSIVFGLTMRIKIEKPNDKNGEELILETSPPPLTATTGGDIWYCSDSVCNLIGGGVLGLMDISYADLPKDQQFNIELAVAAGNIYHMLLGEPQPKFYSGIDENGVYYRLSKKVPEFTTWGNCIKESEAINTTHEIEDSDGDDSEDTTKQYTVLGNKLVTGTNTFELGGQKGEIKRIVSTAIVSFFLNDIDTNPGNFGLVKYGNDYYMIKLDPECCFNHWFFSQDATSIVMAFNDIARNHSRDFLDNFTDNFCIEEIDECNWDVVNGFMSTEAANLEKFAIIYKIINTPLEEYELILRSCIDKKYNDKIEILLNGLRNKIALFSQCANTLKDYKEYCAQINMPEQTELVPPPAEEEMNINVTEQPLEIDENVVVHPSENANTLFSKRKAEATNTSNKRIKIDKTETEQTQNSLGNT